MTDPSHTFTAWPRAESSSDGGVITSEQLIQKAEEHWNVSGSSIIAAWALTFIGAIVIFAVFSWRREKDPMIYLPRVDAAKLRVTEWEIKNKNTVGICPPKVPKVDSGFLAWLTPQFHDFWLEFWQILHQKPILKRDMEILELLGLDAITYIQFLRMLRWLFVTISIFCALPLIFANYHLNTKTVYGSSSTDPDDVSNSTNSADEAKEMAKSMLDNMQLFSAANIKGQGLWVHIGMEWIVTGIILAFVISHSLYHRKLVERWVEMNQCEISFMSLMITNIEIKPEVKTQKKENGVVIDYMHKITIMEAKEKVCRKLKIRERPFPTSGDHADCSVRLTHQNMTHLAEMMEDFKVKHFPQLERSLTAYMRRFKNYFGAGQEYDSWWDRIKGNAKSVDVKTDTQGKLVERKKFLIEQERLLAKGDPDMEDVQTLKGTVNSAFVTFPTARRAHKVLKEYKKLRRHKIGGPTVQNAPRSKNIIWKNLELDAKTRRSHAIGGRIAIGVLYFLNTIPLMAVTILANINFFVEKVDWLRDFRDSSSIWKGLFAVIGGILPPAVAALCGYLLPYAVRWLDRWSGALTRGQLDKSVIRQMFVFLLISNFVVFSLLGILWETGLSVYNDIGKKSWTQIRDGLGDVPVKIARAYIANNAYWLSWFPLRAALVCLQLLQLPRAGLKLWQFFTVASGSDVYELKKPRTFEYAIEYVHILFAMVVALVYAPLAPIVVICGTIYFWAMSIVHYNNLKYIEDTKETDGKVWHVVRNRLLAATVMMQLLMSLTIGLKTKSPTMTLCALIPITFVLVLKQLEIRTNIFPKTTELIGMPPSKGGGGGHWMHDKIPEFEHELLRDDWMPEFHWVAEDRDGFIEAKENFGWANRLFGRGDDDDDLGEKKGRNRSKSSKRRR